MSESQSPSLVFNWPGQTGITSAIWLIILAALLVTSGIGLVLLYYHVRHNPFQDSVNLLNILDYAFPLIILCVILVIRRLFIWRPGGYSVNANEDGLMIIGSHSLHGKLINWQDIGRIQKVSFPTGLKISTLEQRVRLFIPCEAERLSMLLSLMAYQFMAKQPKRQYPSRFYNQYRRIKLALFIGFAGFTSLIAYAYQEIGYLLVFSVIVLYLIIDGLFVQKITLTGTGVTSHTLWSSKSYVFTAIKHIDIFSSHSRNSSLNLIIQMTLERHKAVDLETRGMDPINLYLALFTAWQKASLSINP